MPKRWRRTPSFRLGQRASEAGDAKQRAGFRQLFVAAGYDPGSTSTEVEKGSSCVRGDILLPRSISGGNLLW